MQIAFIIVIILKITFDYYYCHHDYQHDHFYHYYHCYHLITTIVLMILIMAIFNDSDLGGPLMCASMCVLLTVIGIMSGHLMAWPIC